MLVMVDMILKLHLPFLKLGILIDGGHRKIEVIIVKLVNKNR